MGAWPNLSRGDDMNPGQFKTIYRSFKHLVASVALVIGTSFTGILATSLALCGTASASILTTDPSLPPNKGGYFTSKVTYALPGPLVIEISDILHFGFTNIIRLPLGLDERETFDSTVTGKLSVNGNPQGLVELTGSVETIVFGKIGNTTGTFQTEMLQLDLTGGGIMVRESPTLASLGETTITDLGGGTYRIDSFFDIFTELSLDDGTTWIPSSSLERVELIPEPTTLALLAIGLVLSGWSKKRNRV